MIVSFWVKLKWSWFEELLKSFSSKLERLLIGAFSKLLLIPVVVAVVGDRSCSKVMSTKIWKQYKNIYFSEFEPLNFSPKNKQNIWVKLFNVMKLFSSIAAALPPPPPPNRVYRVFHNKLLNFPFIFWWMYRQSPIFSSLTRSLF